VTIWANSTCPLRDKQLPGKYIKVVELKQKLFLTHKMASYNIKQDNIDGVSRNKPKKGKMPFTKSGKLLGVFNNPIKQVSITPSPPQIAPQVSPLIRI
jgi:hypothetical protein